ncbi:MAG: hypothetical protein LBL76_01020 [Treponema sp.]|nr:hypothetical protein [Treponema sp.]
MKAQWDGTEGVERRNREILPLDEYLQISGLPFKMSPEMMTETAFFGVHESSFASAEQMIRKYLPARISDSLIREATEYAGRKTFEEDTRRACPIEQNPDKIPDQPDQKGILYSMVDGTAINTRLKDCQGSTWRGTTTPPYLRAASGGWKNNAVSPSPRAGLCQNSVSCFLPCFIKTQPCFLSIPSSSPSFIQRRPVNALFFS